MAAVRAGASSTEDRNGPDHPGLMPATLLAGGPPDDQLDGDARPVPRSTRDWVIDIVVFACALGGGAALLYFVVAEEDLLLVDFVVDGTAGLLACLALWFRRRWPVAVAIVTSVLATVWGGATIAAMVGLFTVAVHRRARVALALAAANILAGYVTGVLRPPEDATLLELVGWSVTSTLVVVAWGMFARARRQLIWSLRERAERAEAEQRLLAEQARHAERSRIAREMHDVLAHRVSLIALQAGGLEVRPDLPADDVRGTARVIRDTARRALEELRDVIGVLRDEPSDAEPSARTPAPEAPQPTLRDVTRLVEESNRAGAHVTLSMDVESADDAPGTLGRAAYRIVQEALTNVHKHARGAATTVELFGAPGQGLRVRVRNRLASGRSLPGSGKGLVGLAERVALSGGTLSHGPTSTGEFVVDAKLDWPS